MKALLSILSLFFLTFSGKKGVEITFTNDSGETFQKMIIKTRGKEFSFDNICPGETTPPIEVEKTYWFIHTEAITSKDTVVLTGFCTVGETVIEDGKLKVSYDIYPKNGPSRRLYANEVVYEGSAKNVGFKKFVPK